MKLSRRDIYLFWVFCACLLAVGSFPNTSFAQKNDSKRIEFFERRIRPVLVKYCYECHSQKSKEVGGGLLLDTREGIRQGGDSGHAVVPKNINSSLLIDALQFETFEMPPENKLPDAVVSDFVKWIQMGAPDPRDGTLKSSKDTSADLWSLKPIQSVTPPEVKNSSWIHNDIDRFILSRLEQQNLKPVDDAGTLQLLRRVTLDLIGLPPSPAEIDSFLQDDSPRSYAAVVDRLLDSPHFGERWGRYWLDVVRYAESNGKDRDVLFPHAWRYRDYVIKSLNDDKPFDQFLTEQLAGDLVPVKQNQSRDELLIATGFLALTSKSFGGGEKFAMDIVDDQIDVTSRAFLGLTVSCARCHDHKFDPILTKEYYSLAGIFHSTETRYGAGPGGNVKGKDPIARNLLIIGSDSDQKLIAIAEHQKKVDQIITRQKKLNQTIKRLSKFRVASKQTELKQARADLKKIKSDLQKLKKVQPPSLQFAMGVRESKKIADYSVLLRGDVSKKGEKAPRGFPAVVLVSRTYPVDKKQSGRMQFARWMTDIANPLTARVAVNRYWSHLFGKGIVRTVDNFGINGAQPTHPALLDYLATELLRKGWSAKQVIRMMVMSHTYRLGSENVEQNTAVDPDNNYYWKMNSRRLQAEAIRDGMLAASGKLDKSFPNGSPIAEIGDGEFGRNINEKPLQREFNHRSVYLPIIRSHLHEALKIFDFAEPSIVVGQRSVTTVPTQALYFMNSPFVLEQADQTARRILKDPTRSTQEQVTLAYQLCLARNPRDVERKETELFLTKFQEQLKSEDSNSKTSTHKQTAWTAFCQALFATAEFRYVY